MKTRITIDFDAADSAAVSDLTRGVDLNTLLRDALGEFAQAREPVEAYVAQRYASATERFRADKVREVGKRLKLAELLRRGDVTIEIDVDDTGKLPSGHLMSATSKVPCQFCPTGPSAPPAALATICVYRAGPAFDYYCDACADKPGPLGPTPRERVMGKS